jgi:hypothetical protein
MFGSLMFGIESTANCIGSCGDNTLVEFGRTVLLIRSLLGFSTGTARWAGAEGALAWSKRAFALL